MKRRSLLAGILASGFAPAAIGSGVLMPVRRVWAPADEFFMGVVTRKVTSMPFVMADGNGPAVGRRVSRSIDGGKFEDAGLAVEMSNGIYRMDLAAENLNGDVITFRVQAEGCDDLFITHLLSP